MYISFILILSVWVGLLGIGELIRTSLRDRKEERRTRINQRYWA